MVKREKRIAKQIKGLDRIKKEHENKIKFEKGRKDTTKEYWEKEVEGFDEQLKLLTEKLLKIKSKNKSKK